MLGMRTYASLLLVAGVLAAVPAEAAVVTYSDRSAWNGAVTSRTDIDFESLSTGYSSSTTVGTLPDTVNFIGYGVNALFQIHPSVEWAWSPSGQGQFLYASEGANAAARGLQATFALTSVNAFGVNLWTMNGAAKPVTVRIVLADNSVTTQVVNTNTPDTAPVFIGATSDQSIVRVEFETAYVSPSDNPYVALDNFSWGQFLSEPPPPPTTDTPDSATLGYVGIGILGVLLGTHKRKMKFGN